MGNAQCGVEDRNEEIMNFINKAKDSETDSQLGQKI